MLNEKILARLKKAILYNPVNGTFVRSHNKSEVYLKPNATGAPRILVNSQEFSARSAAWFLMTGEYPGRWDLRSIDGNPANLVWTNLAKAKQGHKFCSKCKTEKPFSEYYSNIGKRDKLDCACKACNKGMYQAQARRQNLKQFGLTQEQYDAMLQKQNNACAICKQPETIGRNLAIDHCHNTGTIRGLLCMRCNTAIGKLNTQDLLFTAAKYLAP